MAWFASDDTGTSSQTIARHMLGLPHNDGFGISEPCDGGDLGRCLRLLAKIPEWEPRVPELAKLSHTWAALVPQWDRLKALMIEETGPEFTRGKSAPRTYALIRQLTDESRKQDGWVPFGNLKGVSIRGNLADALNRKGGKA